MSQKLILKALFKIAIFYYHGEYDDKIIKNHHNSLLDVEKRKHFV